MNKPEIALLLAFCAAFDQRTIGDADVEAWHVALDAPWVPNLGLEEAQEAVLAHYRATSDRIAPAGILGRVRDARAVQLSRVLPQAQGSPPTSEYQEARAALDAALPASKRQRDPRTLAQEQLAKSRLERHAELDEMGDAS